MTKLLHEDNRRRILADHLKNRRPQMLLFWLLFPGHAVPYYLVDEDTGAKTSLLLAVCRSLTKQAAESNEGAPLAPCAIGAIDHWCDVVKVLVAASENDGVPECDGASKCDDLV